ncbi:MAG: hypothetical protein ACOH2M_09130 [Cypionkella sp.]|jgi:hypothetical protein
MQTSNLQTTTIAELVFADSCETNFARLVADLARLLARFPRVPRRLKWDSDTAITYDLPGTRITLALCDLPNQEAGSILCLSVGPCTERFPPLSHSVNLLDASRHAALCSRMAENLIARLSPDMVFWRETTQDIEAEDLETLVAAEPAPQPLPAKARASFAPLEDATVSDLITRGFGSPAAQARLKQRASNKAGFAAALRETLYQ